MAAERCGNDRPDVQVRLILALALCLTPTVCSLRAQEPGPTVELISGLHQPRFLLVGGESGQAMVFEEGRQRIVRPAAAPSDLRQTDIVASDLLGPGPDRFDRVTGMVLHNKNILSVAGLSDGVMRLVSYQWDPIKPAAAIPGLSGDLSLGTSTGTVRDMLVAATDFAVYVSVAGDGTQSAIVRVPLGRATLGKPAVIYKQPAALRPTAMTINDQGQLVLASAESGRATRLRMIHAESGLLLLETETDLDQIRAVSYDGAGLLYAAAEQSGREGVYRLDATFQNGRQRVRATELASVPGIVSLGWRADECLVLVGGETNGRLVQIDFAE